LTISTEYTETEEVIGRHATLLATQQDLRGRDRTNVAKIDAIKARATAFREQHRVHMLDCNALVCAGVGCLLD
jgi:hypothetical protein